MDFGIIVFCCWCLFYWESYYVWYRVLVFLYFVVFVYCFGDIICFYVFFQVYWVVLLFVVYVIGICV